MTKHEQASRNALAAKTALELFCTGTKKLEAPLSYGKLLDEFNVLLKSWNRALRGLENCRDCIHRLGVDQKGAAAAAKKTYHEQKQKIIAWISLKATGVPAELAFAYGELLYYRAAAPEPFGIPRKWQVDEFYMPLEGDPRAAFRDPPLFSKYVLESDPKHTVWHKACATFHGLNHDAIMERFDAQVPKLTTQKKKYGATMGVTEVAGHVFNSMLAPT